MQTGENESRDVLEVCICIGTSCHLRGAEQVVECLQHVLERRGLDDRVVVKGSFCLDHCSEEVSVRIGEDYYQTLPEKVESTLLPIVESKIGTKGDRCTP